jgi:hypothetical protein
MQDVLVDALPLRHRDIVTARPRPALLLRGTPPSPLSREPGRGGVGRGGAGRGGAI